MINPGVVSLASLQCVEKIQFPYRFEVEDNIGEAIHIHYKDIRLDLTVGEFNNLADKMYEIIDDIVGVESFSCKDFDPVVLVGISGALPRLKEVKYRSVHLEDIQVDTFDEDGNPILADISHSRVYKALNGIETENNNNSIQFNFFQPNATEKMSNKERVLFNLEKIKAQGYPYNNELIGINSANQIWDGQHRAACLYYLYGNIEVKVRELVWGETREEECIHNTLFEEDEYTFLLEERQEDEKPCEIQKPNIIKRILKNIVWQTMSQGDNTRNEMRERLENIEKMLEER